MPVKRRLIKTYTPAGHQGFLGAGHIAKPVIQIPFDESDPFIMLMDDMLDKKDEEPVGGPHPHAGFETVTLVLEGELGDDKHTMKAGDFQLMTAGSGIVHTETIDKIAKMRILQLWLTLPKEHRRALPRIQDLSLEKVPRIVKDGLEIRLYSGSLAGATSPILNYAPLILADIQMQPNVSTVVNIPASYTTFLYVIDGDFELGDDKAPLKLDQVGWLNRIPENIESELKLTAGKSGGRVILYSGEPQKAQIVSHGPFIADTMEDISGLYQEYRHGKMKHISTVGKGQKLRW